MRGEGSVTARLLQSAPAVISQGSGRDGDAETLVTAVEETEQLNERRRQ